MFVFYLFSLRNRPVRSDCFPVFSGYRVEKFYMKLIFFWSFLQLFQKKQRKCTVCFTHIKSLCVSFVLPHRPFSLRGRKTSLLGKVSGEIMYSNCKHGGTAIAYIVRRFWHGIPWHIGETKRNQGDSRGTFLSKIYPRVLYRCRNNYFRTVTRVQSFHSACQKTAITWKSCHRVANLLLAETVSTS